MKIVSLKQNGQEWRTWRGLGLGASDAPAVMGESPWTSPFELWLQKTGFMERPTSNEYQIAAMKRGTELEPVVRDMFEKKMGKKYPAVSAQHSEHSFLRASFDGYNEETECILEIKCPSKIDHAKALKGEVPRKYLAQVQQQLLISKAKLCYYVSWDGKSNDLAIVKVEHDLEYQKQLLDNSIDFWARVQNKVLPDVQAKDVAKIVKQLDEHLNKASKLSIVLGLVTK